MLQSSTAVFHGPFVATTSGSRYGIVSRHAYLKITTQGNDFRRASLYIALKPTLALVVMGTHALFSDSFLQAAIDGTAGVGISNVVFRDINLTSPTIGLNNEDVHCRILAATR